MRLPVLQVTVAGEAEQVYYGLSPTGTRRATAADWRSARGMSSYAVNMSFQNRINAQTSLDVAGRSTSA